MMDGEMVWKIVSMGVAAISLPTLWLLVRHIQSHTAHDAQVDGRLAKAEGLIESNKAAAETAARGLQHQIDSLNAEDEKLEGLIVEQRKATDASQKGLTGAISSLEVAIAHLTATLDTRPCQRGGYSGRSNPGRGGSPADADKQPTCSEEE